MQQPLKRSFAFALEANPEVHIDGPSVELLVERTPITPRTDCVIGVRLAYHERDRANHGSRAGAS